MNKENKMFAKYLIAGAPESALMATVAFAQTRATTATNRADMPAAGMSFQGDWRTSKVVGLKIYNDNGNSIGSIDDLLTDKDGNIKAVVVAVPFDKIRFVNEPVSSTTASTTPSDATARPLSSTTTGAATTSTVPTGSAHSIPRQEQGLAVRLQVMAGVGKGLSRPSFGVWTSSARPLAPKAS
jgi:PRC-barrel domain